MRQRQTVTREEWLEVRKALLTKEKAFTKARDELTQERQSLARIKIDKDYVFDGPKGKQTLADMFDGRSQLIIYHFMFGPDWEEGCATCSFWADNYEGVAAHLNARDISMVTVSSGPLARLQDYKARMGWSFNWVSSQGSDFNADFDVSFSHETPPDAPNYNFETQTFGGTEAPGLSVFEKDADGTIFHTYSTYSRGLDMFNVAYHLMDVTPKGRDEKDLPFTMSWICRHDRYVALKW